MKMFSQFFKSFFVQLFDIYALVRPWHSLKFSLEKKFITYSAKKNDTCQQKKPESMSYILQADF